MAGGGCLDLAGRIPDEDAPMEEETSVAGQASDRNVRELFLELRAPLCRYLVALGLQSAEAEDVAQESFVRLCERGDGDTENIRGWMFRVAHNLALDEHRRRKRRQTEALAEDEEFEYADGRPGPEQNLLELERDARMKAAMARLPERQRQCLHLRASGLKYREIAEVLNVGTSTVAEWVQKGLSALGRELS